MGRFDDRATLFRGPRDLIQWRVLDRLAGRTLPRDRSGFAPPLAHPDVGLLRSGTPALAWIGHATFVMRLGGKLIATDPVFSTRISGVLRRIVPPGISLRALLPLDIVTVSHNHLDHLDMPTLKRIGPGALFIVPVGNARYLRRAGLTRVIELEWWQTHREGDLAITLVPARHWSVRRPWDKNDALWGGFVYQSAQGTAYHSGDTAYFDGFREIGERLGPIDWALLPIGSYEPRWFMESQHMNPEDAGKAFLDLGAQNLVAMHWGTFNLTDEPVAEPPQRLRAFFRERGLAEQRAWVMNIGETRRLVRQEAQAA